MRGLFNGQGRYISERLVAGRGREVRGRAELTHVNATLSLPVLPALLLFQVNLKGIHPKGK